MRRIMENFQIKYTHCEAGWLDFTVTYGKEKLEYYFSYCCSSPKDLLEWAENVYKCNYTEFSNESEGWEWYFNYDGEFLTISDTLNLNDENPNGEKRNRLHIKIEKKELCKTIYNSLKEFQVSDLYIAREWESLYLKQIFEKTYGSVENAINTISKMTLAEIIEDIKSKDTNDELGFYITGFFDAYDNDAYDSAEDDEKKMIINDYLKYDSGDYGGFDGVPLTSIKSVLFDKVFQLQVE